MTGTGTHIKKTFQKMKRLTKGIETIKARPSKRAVINLRIEDDLKHQVELVLDELGLSAPEAVTQLYRYLPEHKQMPLVEVTRTFIKKPLPIRLESNPIHERDYRAYKELNHKEEI